MNSKRGINSQFIRILVTVIILYSITTIVSRLISNYLTTYFYLGVLFFCIVLVMVQRGANSLSDYIVLIIPFVVWKLLIFLVTKPSIIDWGYNSLLDFTPIILGLFITKRLDRYSVSYFSIIIIIAVLVTMLTTYIGLQEYPDAARYLATVADANESANVKYGFMNIGGYTFIYTTVLLYPLLIYAHKRDKINLFWTVLFSMAELAVVIISGYTTALLLWMLSTIFLFFGKNFKARYLIIVIIVAALVFFVFFDLVSQGFKFLADNVGNKEMSERFNALSGGISGVENSESDRIKLWTLSLNTFFAHPFFGSLGGGWGGHSFILDNMAQYGLLGIAIFATLYTIIFKRFFLPYKNTQGYGYVVWMFVQTLILSTVNTGMWLYILCLYIPTILAFINNGGLKNEGVMGSQLGIERFKRRAIR